MRKPTNHTRAALGDDCVRGFDTVAGTKMTSNLAAGDVYRDLASVPLGVTLALVAMLTALFAPAQHSKEAPVRAKTADSFVQSLGIDTHINFLSTPYGDYDELVKPALAELGVKHARDAAVATGNSTVWARYADLCSTLDIRYTLNVNPDVLPTAPTAAQIDQMVSQSGCAIEMFEGPNEYNNGRSDTAWVRELEAYQRQLFEAVNASSYPDIPVLAAPLGKEAGDYPAETPNLGPYSDFNSVHSYPGGNPPTFGNPSDPESYSLLYDKDIPKSNQVGNPGRDIYVTETGYTTAPGNVNEVSNEAQAKYTLRLAFEYFRATNPQTGEVQPIKRGYHYQLLDHMTGAAAQAHFGLVRYDGTRKLAFRALENTVDILEDPGGPFVTGSLDYTLVNTSPDVHQTLLQKRDGTFYLALWQEVRSYDKTTDRDIGVVPQKVTVQFPNTVRMVRVYDPTNIVSSGPADDAENHPDRTLSSVSSVTELIADQVKIIQVTQGVAPRP